MIDAIKKLFRRNHITPRPAREGQGGGSASTLRIEGTKPAPLTPEPDDAELAAAALLELLVERPTPNPSLRGRGRDTSAADHSAAGHTTPLPRREGQGGGSAAYYHALAERIRLARDQATLRTMRFVTWCEQELERRDLPIEGKGSLAQMEAELYKRIDTIERVGGELKRRWQHCLAEVIVRRMGEEREATEDGRRKMEDEESSEQPADPNEDTTETTVRP